MGWRDDDGQAVPFGAMVLAVGVACVVGLSGLARDAVDAARAADGRRWCRARRGQRRPVGRGTDRGRQRGSDDLVVAARDRGGYSRDGDGARR